MTLYPHTPRHAKRHRVSARRVARIRQEAEQCLLRHFELADELRAEGAIVTVDGRTTYTWDAIVVLDHVLRTEEQWAKEMRAALTALRQSGATLPPDPADWPRAAAALATTEGEA